MSGSTRAATVGAVFGLVFVELNAGMLHPHRTVLAVRIAGAGLFVIAILRLIAARRRQATVDSGEAFGVGYWVVALLEVAALAAGLLILSGKWHVHVIDEHIHGLRAHAASAERAWVATIVGVHFLGLAMVWRRGATGLLGLAVTACGVAALVIANRGSSAATGAIVAGVVPGALLLLSALLRRVRD